MHTDDVTKRLSEFGNAVHNQVMKSRRFWFLTSLFPSRPSLPGGSCGGGDDGGRGGGDHGDRPRPHVARHRLRSCRRFRGFILRVSELKEEGKAERNTRNPFRLQREMRKIMHRFLF